MLKFILPNFSNVLRINLLDFLGSFSLNLWHRIGMIFVIYNVLFRLIFTNNRYGHL